MNRPKDSSAENEASGLSYSRNLFICGQLDVTISVVPRSYDEIRWKVFNVSPRLLPLTSHSSLSPDPSTCSYNRCLFFLSHSYTVVYSNTVVVAITTR